MSAPDEDEDEDDARPVPDAELVASTEFMRPPQKRAVYPRYRYAGATRDMLSRTRDGAPIAYEVVEEHGRDLVVIGRSGELEVRVSVSVSAAEKDYAHVALATVSERVVANKLAHRTLLHASGLAMLWDWPKGIEADVPAEVSAELVRAFKLRRKLARVRRTRRDDGREILVYAIHT